LIPGSRALFDFPRSKPGVPCRVCQLPPAVLAEIMAERAKPNPRSFSTISRWLLAEHNIQIGFQSLGHHVREGHPNTGGKP